MRPIKGTHTLGNLYVYNYMIAMRMQFCHIHSVARHNSVLTDWHTTAMPA